MLDSLDVVQLDELFQLKMSRVLQTTLMIVRLHCRGSRDLLFASELNEKHGETQEWAKKSDLLLPYHACVKVS